MHLQTPRLVIAGMRRLALTRGADATLSASALAQVLAQLSALGATEVEIVTEGG